MFTSFAPIQMLHNTAKPRVTPRSQKSYRGANNHTAEPNFLPRSHNISTAELTPRRGAFLSLPRNQKSYRGTKYPTAEPFYIYRGTNTTARRICVPLGFSSQCLQGGVEKHLLSPAATFCHLRETQG